MDKFYQMLYYGGEGVKDEMISYKKLRLKVHEKELRWCDIKNEIGVSNDVIAKINKDDYITLKTLERFAEYFGCDIGDLVEIKK